MTKKTIYFLCTGNSCRSQMAEGFGKRYLTDRYDVYSAGVEAHGLNPDAVEAMREKEIDISGQTSNILDPAIIQKAHLVITLCGDAKDRCPTIPSHIQSMHWGFDDPAKAEGTDEEKWQVFRRVRNEIEAKIKEFSNDGR